ncbi:hypothetical protein F5Y15DRAFT_63937 [Xylariaceae sp. FL0016]|nr:hypothetical protein F5Y15DRAFT_63937 [Xylariaceae sp. FL0016]
MQKVLRRVATAERVVAKRAKKKDRLASRNDIRETRQETSRNLQFANEDVGKIKQAIKDDWEMGPIAPRRDFGDWQDAHGAIHEVRFNGYGVMTDALRNKRSQWAGGIENLNLAKGDRVVLLDGPDKGKIGHIQDVDKDRAEVTVANLNKSNVRIQPVLRTDAKTSAMNLELPIPISGVRLVHPIKDPETNLTRDVIINQLITKQLIHDRVTGKKQWQRIVPGLNVSIPWPVKNKPKPKEYKADTLRIDAEDRTFVPTLLRPPMPEAVVDELRNKYSRFRTRHTPEYLEKLEAPEREKAARAALMESMRTPLQELHRAERASKKKKGKPRLSLEMLEKIGEVIAKNRERSLNAAGVADAKGLPPASTTTALPEVPIQDAQETNSPRSV